MPSPHSRDVDAAIAAADGVMDRARARAAAPAAPRLRRRARRLQRFMAMVLAGLATLFVATGAWALLIGPIGIIGVALVGMIAAMLIVGAAAVSREGEVSAESIAAGTLPEMADRTAQYLGQQRAALPAPAQGLADSIGQRIAALRPQLIALPAHAPEAEDLRRLLGTELPDLVTSYARVPAGMRREERNGRIAENELIDGMRLLDREVDDLARTLAATDMDRLSSQKRYLELRYEGDGAAPSV